MSLAVHQASGIGFGTGRTQPKMGLIGHWVWRSQDPATIGLGIAPSPRRWVWCWPDQAVVGLAVCLAQTRWV